jgi:predicted RNA-binding Zn-ribbon protein involved in translation (DUF1610 family)
MNKSNPPKIQALKRSTEVLSHFSCGACGKWWTVGDAPKKKKHWYCPWCGFEVKLQ